MIKSNFYIIVLISCVLLAGNLKAQTNTASDVAVISSNPASVSAVKTGTSPLQLKCKEFTDRDFIPDEWSDTIFYRTNFHFFKRKNGAGPYDSVNIREAMTLVDDFNYRFSHLEAPMLKHPSNPPLITDSKIRLKLSGYYTHTSDSAFMPGCYNGLDIYNKYNIGGDSIINVFFISEAALGNGGHGTYSLPAYVYMNVTNPRYYFWAFLDLFVHEMGHSAGYLYHTDLAELPDYVVENSNDPNKWGWIPCKKDTVGNNILGYNRCRMYLSPMQIGRWRKWGTIGDRARYTDNCTYNSSKTVSITAKEIWNDPKIMNGDIVVKRGGTLIVKCNVYMASGSRVIIEEGGKMRLEAASILSNCSSWKGVEIWGNTKKAKTVKSDTELSDFQGILELTPGSIISNAKTGITLGKRKSSGKFVKGSGGGILIMDKGNLVNNTKDVEYESVPKK